MKRTLLSALIAWCVCLAVLFWLRRLHFGVLLLSNILAAAIIEILLFGMTQRRWVSFSAAALIVFTAQFTVVIPSVHKMAVYPVNMEEMRARAKQDPGDHEMSEYLENATEEDVRRTAARGLILSTCVIFIPTILFGALAGRMLHHEDGGGSSTAE